MRSEAAALNRDDNRIWLIAGATCSLAAVASLWWYVLARRGIDLPSGSGPPLQLGLQAAGVAALFGPLVAIEAVSHERLFTSGVDPLSGYSSRRFAVNQLFLRGSVEQYLIYAAGLLGLAVTAPPEAVRPSIVLATLIWIVQRVVFRIGYAFGSQYRGFGLGGYAQNLVILLYVTVHWAGQVGGSLGQIIAIGAFILIEAALVADAIAAGQAEQRASDVPPGPEADDGPERG